MIGYNYSFSLYQLISDEYHYSQYFSDKTKLSIEVEFGLNSTFISLLSHNTCNVTSKTAILDHQS